MIRSSTTWRGRPALRLIGERHEAVVTVVGAQLASLHLRGETLSPLWQPPWLQAADPLLDAICGSNLCLDRFGPAWPGEAKPLHGEATVATWESAQEDDVAVMRTYLPLAGLAVERRFRFVPGGLELTTLATPVAGRQPLVEWCEHTTLGDPFLDGCEFTAGCDAWLGMPGYAPAPGVAALGFPLPGSRPRGDIAAGRVAAGWWQAVNPRLGRTLRVSWNAADFPWLCLWTEHCRRSDAPWRGQTRARGMELSTKPFPDGIPGVGLCPVPTVKRVVLAWG